MRKINGHKILKGKECIKRRNEEYIKEYIKRSQILFALRPLEISQIAIKQSSKSYTKNPIRKAISIFLY